MHKLLLSLGLALSALGAHAADMHHDHLAQTAPAAAASEGEVRKIDAAAGKLTLKHGELKNLGMPPMTMVFLVKDRAALGKLKVGDKVRFVAAEANGTLVASDIQVVK